MNLIIHSNVSSQADGNSKTLTIILGKTHSWDAVIVLVLEKVHQSGAA